MLDLIWNVHSFILPNNVDRNLYVASGSGDGSVKIWSLDTFTEVLSLEGYSGN